MSTSSEVNDCVARDRAESVTAHVIQQVYSHFQSGPSTTRLERPRCRRQPFSSNENLCNCQQEILLELIHEKRGRHCVGWRMVKLDHLPSLFLGHEFATMKLMIHIQKVYDTSCYKIVAQVRWVRAVSCN